MQHSTTTDCDPIDDLNMVTKRVPTAIQLATADAKTMGLIKLFVNKLQ